MKYPRLVMAAAVLAAAASMQAKIVTQAVQYEHEGVQLEGWLSYDDRVSAPRPGVLVIHEWWGLNDYVKGRAEQLARLGYVAFALDMYGKGVKTTDPKKAAELAGQFYGKPLMAARARAGLEQLTKSGKVAQGKVAAIGFCFGGSTAQALAYSGAPIAGAVSFHGNPVPAPAGAKVRAKILMLHGAADTFIKPEEIAKFEKAATDAGIDWQWISYANALHAFTNPDAGSFGIPGIAYDENAARRSWQHMRVFFGEIFSRRVELEPAK
jgi:dienelactone hydrolase